MKQLTIDQRALLRRLKKLKISDEEKATIKAIAELLFDKINEK